LWIEDPSLSFSINSYSDELEISLYGLTQKEIIQTLLEERFSVKVHFDEIKTIYKERPIKKVNKIIQIEVPPNPYWATIGLTLEPLPLGTGLQIESDISYGYLNHSFQNAVFEGIRMSCQSGLHGWEVTDLKVTFTQAEYYSPVSTPADFRQLTPYVFRLALQQSGVDILEPMLYFELQIPQAASSKAITDLQKMMSEIEDISCNNEWCHIKGKVPLNTSKDYASEVSSYTKGLGILPAALSTGIGSESQRPLAIVIIGGLITATFFVLFVFPLLVECFYHRFLYDEKGQLRVRKL
jgi:ribosomal protection tetracycline resistance protein